MHSWLPCRGGAGLQSAAPAAVQAHRAGGALRLSASLRAPGSAPARTPLRAPPLMTVLSFSWLPFPSCAACTR